MNTEFFIARRVVSFGNKNAQKTSFSRLIIRIAVVSVALSVAVMIIATSMVAGFKHEISRKIFGFWGHIHITDTNINRTQFEPAPIDRNQDFIAGLDTIRHVRYYGKRKIFGISFGNPDVLKTTKGGFKHAHVFAIKPGIIKTKKQIEGIILKGIDTDFDWDEFEQYIVKGRPIRFNDSTMSKDILISRTTADRLDVDVDDKFIIHFVEGKDQIQRVFKVSGIYKTGLGEYDRKLALVDIRQIQKLLNWNQNEVSGFEITIDDIDDLDVLTEYIYVEKLPNNLYAENIREKFPSIFDWLDLQDINGYVILALMLLVSILNMVTALLILILERSNMIGILKSLGSRDWKIRKIFLYYGGWILVNGLFWGNLIGILVSLAEKHFKFIKLSEADYYLSYAPVEIHPQTILLLNLGTLLITLLVLIIPSYLISKISPVKVLRFK